MVRWTDDQVAILSRLYPDMRTGEVAKRLGVTVRRVYFKAHLLGLKKSHSYLTSPESPRIKKGDSLGKGTQFKKGHTTWNKGMKGLDTGGAETRFKHGNISGRAAQLYRPIGSERISKDGYLERKVSDSPPPARRWRGVHNLVWEAANGTIPKGHAVTFKDGDKHNLNPDNLELVTRAELMRRNSYHQYGPEIARLVQLRGAVSRQINKKEKQA